MGLFSAIKNTYKKSEAAVVVQNLLEIQFRIVLLDANPASIANKLIDSVWSEAPHLFDGRFGQRPHKISVAASALAKGVTNVDDDDPLIYPLMMSIGKILDQVSINGHLFPLNSIDHELLGKALQVFTTVSQKLEQTPLAQELNHLLSPRKMTWKEWIAEYKDEAGKHNPGLAIDENGFSLIDMMDDEPLRRAYRDRVEPRNLGREFALQFDPLKMGVM